ncbi:6-carboxytetrahydropterin synthase [Candidatus Borrarchaeum sp.]|uniref:6-carboxytetrahydropterin synthase n=1 Tax=Candidatus Borrarchaeum sp. TaxID=2846742 RepID=UPI00257AF085|nr:6-carboxytetrahydropterin synthase [Candidatus Borrarchaeum sp.]
MFEIKVQDSFDACHFLVNTNTQCDNLHGHRWTVWVTFRSDELSSKGWVINFTLVKKWLKEVLQDFDHNVLNYFLDQPTAENLCYVVFRHLHFRLYDYNGNSDMQIILKKVEIAETPGNTASYSCSDINVRKESLRRGRRKFWKSEGSEKTRKKIGKASKDRWVDPNKREEMTGKILEANKDPEQRRRKSERMKLNNPMKNRRNVEKMIASLRKTQKLSPNREEQKVIEFMKENKLSFLFVGDGSYIVDGKIPDFINKSMRVVVEYNSRFWHSDDNPWYNTSDDSEDRRKFFEARGYKFYIIWSDEFETSKEKIIRDLRALLE